MPLLLYTYLITEMLAPFFASLIILNAILFLGRLIRLFDIIFGFGIGLADFARLAAYMAPKTLLFSLPMASMMGVIIAMTRMINDNEVMALKANGIGLYRMLPAVTIVALCTAALTALTAVTFIPKGTVAMQQLFFQLAKEKFDRGIQEKQFSEGIKDVVLYVERIDPLTKGWSGVYVSDLRDPKTPVTIMAQTGGLAASVREMRITLQLADGSLHRALGPKTQTLFFKDYTLNLPIQPPASIAGESITQIGKDGMGLAGLRRAAGKLDRGDPKKYEYLIEFHQRLVLPVGCFFLSLLALPLTLVGRPAHRSMGVPLGLLIFILYYVLFTAAKAFSEDGAVPVGLAMWLPNFLFAVATFIFTRRVAGELGNPLYEKLLEAGQTLIDRLPWRQKEKNS